MEAIRRWLPCPFFARWPLRCGLLWTPRRLVWVALLMAWSAEQTLAERFAAALELLAVLFPRWRRGGGYTGWSAAAQAWSAPCGRPWRRPACPPDARLRRQALAARGPLRLLRRRLAGGVPAHRGQRGGGTGRGRPRRRAEAAKLFLTTLWHMGLGLPWDYRIGPGTDSERRHLVDMLGDLPDDALVVADAGFSGYDLYRRLPGARRSFLLRVGSNVHLLRRLGYAEREGPDTVYLWPEARRDQPPVVLRLIVLTRGPDKAYLVTDVLDEAALPASEAALLYEMRWGVEVFYRSCKQTLQRRRMLSRTPGAAREELAWSVLGLWLLGMMTASAIAARGGDPLAWSVAQARGSATAAAASGRRPVRAGAAGAGAGGGGAGRLHPEGE